MKVNLDTVIYPDLISLEVSESDVLSRAADELASRVRPTDAAADRVRPEVPYCLASALLHHKTCYDVHILFWSIKEILDEYCS